MPGISVLPPNPMAPPTTGQSIGSALGMMAQALPQGIQAALEHKMRKEQMAIEAQRTKDYGEYFRGMEERGQSEVKLREAQERRAQFEMGLKANATQGKTLKETSPEFQAMAREFIPGLEPDFDLSRLQKESEQLKVLKYLEDKGLLGRHIGGEPKPVEPTEVDKVRQLMEYVDSLDLPDEVKIPMKMALVGARPETEPRLAADRGPTTFEIDKWAWERADSDVDNALMQGRIMTGQIDEYRTQRHDYYLSLYADQPQPTPYDVGTVPMFTPDGRLREELP